MFGSWKGIGAIEARLTWPVITPDYRTESILGGGEPVTKIGGAGAWVPKKHTPTPAGGSRA